MALNLPMATIVLRSQRRCDKENDLSIDTSEWKAMVSEVRREAYELVADTGCRHFETEYAIPVNGAASYAVPADLRNLIGVDYITADGCRIELEELMIQERNAFSQYSGQALAYTHAGGNIALVPAPASGTYKLLYVPQASDLSAAADADYVDLMCGAGERFVTWGVAILANQKSRGDFDVPFALREREKAREDLQYWAANEAIANPRRRVSGDLRRRYWR
jgi:hypothetical protein